MTRKSLRLRRAFTLLEMILSLSIGLMILAALYSVLSSQFRLTQAGRDLLDDGTVARAVFSRMADDIQGNLGPLDLRVLPENTATSDAEEGMEGEDTEMTETDMGTTAKPMTTTNPAMTPAPTEKNAVVFNIGVEGGEDYMILVTSKAMRPGGLAGNQSGLRRVMYWLVAGEKGGLARKEITDITGEGYNLRPEAVGDVDKAVMAPEVRKVKFEYFDGGGWVTLWKGSDPAGDVNNPIGPPSAIRITLSLRKRGGGTTSSGEEVLVEYQHVVALPAGNHFPTEEP
jgi:prepilin-type N-terminal cleavage/methylation domain-containing protein